MARSAANVSDFKQVSTPTKHSVSFVKKVDGDHSIARFR